MIIRFIVVFIYGVLALGCGSSSSTSEVENDKYNLDKKSDLKEANLKRLKTDQSDSIQPLIEYRFDLCEIGSSLTDELGTFDATIKNHPSLVSSTLNSAIRLDGKDDYIQLPSMDVDYSNGFTFSAWVMFDEKAGSGKNWETIFSFGNDDSNQNYEDKHKTEIWLNRYYNSNKLYFAFTNGDRDDLCGDIKTVDDVLKPKTMQHIAVSIDDRNYPHIFIDGKEVETEVAWHNEGGACELPSVSRDLCYIGKPNDEWIGLDDDNGHKDHKDNNFLKGVIDEVKIYNQTLTLKDLNELYKSEKSGLNYDKSSRESMVCEQKPEPKPVANIDDDPFSTIKSILSLDNSTYICVGDSTRADDSHFKNDKIFKNVSTALGAKTHSILEAYPGVEAKYWARDTIESLVSQITESGGTTVINISLGINDARVGASKANIKSYITSGIDQILEKKPNTYIMLTMPNKMIGIDSTPYLSAYEELSKKYPMIDTRDIFSSDDFSLYRSDDATEYGKDIRIHLSSKGQKLVSDKIIQNIK